MPVAVPAKSRRLNTSMPIPIVDPASSSSDYLDIKIKKEKEDVGSEEVIEIEHPMRRVRSIDLEDVQVDEENDRDPILYGGNREEGFITNLRQWAFLCQIPDEHVTDLLQILKSTLQNTLPVDAKTLLRAPRPPTIAIPMGAGQYFHYGLEMGLKSYRPCELVRQGKIVLDIAADWFLIEDKCGWTIFGSIANSSMDPFLIGLYVGSKVPPPSDQTLTPFCKELGELRQKGGISLILTDDFDKTIVVPIEIRCFVSDSPVRGHVLHHNQYRFCDKCVDKADETGNMGCVKKELRTDTSFACRRDKFYHMEHYNVSDTSILELHDFQMVSQFPLDVMKILDLGLGKLIITSLLTKKTVGSLPLLTAALSKQYAEYSKYTPSEFSRTPRCLSEVQLFSAAEFRQFLLYTGVVFLKHYLSEPAYVHFLNISAAYRVILSTNYDVNNGLERAEKMFADFVKDFKSHYDLNVSYNIHSLLHIVDCVRRFGKADNFSGYKYEKATRKIQKYIIDGKDIFNEISNRLGVDHEFPHFMGNEKPQGLVKAGASVKDMCYMICNREGSYSFGMVVQVLDCKDKCVFRSYKTKKDFFQKPLNSSIIGIVEVRESELGPEIVVKCSALKRKCYKLPYAGDKFVLIPLIG